MPNNVMNTLGSEQGTITSGASLSSSVNLGGLRLFGIVMPVAWTAASLTFQVSIDGGTTWNNMYDSSGNEISVTASASRFIPVDPLQFAAVPMIKVRSGTSASPVAQGQDSVLTLVLRVV